MQQEEIIVIRNKELAKLGPAVSAKTIFFASLHSLFHIFGGIAW